MARWLMLLSALCLLAHTSAHSLTRLAAHSRPQLTVRSQTDTATTLSRNTTITDPASYVNVFIGTTNGGHVFPGATLPHGMVKVGLDTDSPGNQAGYDANSTFNATGFSQLHDSGTGGGSSLSNFKLWPLPECESFASCNTSMSVRKTLRKVLPDGSPDDAGSPGYFATNLSTGVRVELTASRRAALHRYTFPPSSREPRIVVDITNDGLISNTEPVVNVNTTTGRITGGARFASSFGPGRYNVYTCVDFKGDGYDFQAPAEYGVWLGNAPGALLTFPPSSNSIDTTILARVGVSFISSDQACANAESEIPDFDFDGTVATARETWNELLSRIQVDTQGVDKEFTELFYSSLYRTHISPADYTGENPNWNSAEPYYDSFYCNWDTYRTMYPLMSLHDPEVFARIVRGMINIQKHEGWLPECRGATLQQYIQGGSNGDPILGEFFVKFYEHASALNVSADDLYTALLADAEDQPPNWNLQGRQATVWKQYSFIPSNIYASGGAATKQVSRTLEYSFNDFSISQVAKILNKTDDVAKYQARAGNFINVWNERVTLPEYPSIKGMMQASHSPMTPRFVDGEWSYTDPRHCSVNDPLHSTCYLDATNRDGFYESSPMVYVPQDTAKLILLQGGNESFIDRLNLIFDQHYFDVTDEPSQQIPFMYHYADRPGLSTQRSRMIIAESYNTTVNGLPGNDDSGAMASYAVFYLMGMYPLPATRQILLASPYFPKVSFYNPVFNTTTTIIANNFSGNPQDGKGGTVFVKSVTIDGQPWHSNCYLDWDVFVKGSTVELELTSDIDTTCGEGPDALPPSLSTGGYSGPI
ncbi:glycoside hydrolase family 92 protein [Suillus paluster]|uniref:glycoside hydrolase family 92 protein n=1 Tax=Suillus paluster TaxID=48578 RepID=UPI001B85CE2E|nr:glycoside hydrolase family 92 protein [Suillus paluster]KAG1749718.1 glycoside hydrolase family 92 protein [Suillus paluster]